MTSHRPRLFLGVYLAGLISILMSLHQAQNAKAAKRVAPRQTAGPVMALELVATGLENPLYITHAGDDRLMIIEQPGRIRILRGGVLLTTPFLDITARVDSSGNEQGLLGVAFHPQYAVPETEGAGLFDEYLVKPIAVDQLGPLLTGL